MAEGQLCVICNTRRPRRYCPGVTGDICAVCCGTEREKTVSCPLDCPYLREARIREKEPYVDPARVPKSGHQDRGRVSSQERAASHLFAGGFAKCRSRTAGAIDIDVREAIDSLIQTYKTLQSGLVYEARPDNPIAARIQSGVRRSASATWKRRCKRNNSTLRDSDVLGVLVFLQRLEMQKNNRSRRKAARLSIFCANSFPAGAAEARGIEPDSAMTGIVLFAHGSTVESANEAVHAVTAEFARRPGRLGRNRVSGLRAAATLADAVAKLAARGAHPDRRCPIFSDYGHPSPA